MSIFQWLFGKTEKHRESSGPSVTITACLEKVEPSPTAYEEFTGEIAGAAVRAEVPIDAKTECERLLRKSNRSNTDNTYLHDNYWVTVHYKNACHGYHGIKGMWSRLYF
jgi:hypothetical protein